MRPLLAACLLLGGCAVSPAPTAEPSTAVVNHGSGDDGSGASGERIDGDVACSDGSFTLPAGGVINGDLDASDCTLDIAGTVNGTITATGGAQIVVAGARVNGGIDVEQAADVTVEASEFNGDGWFGSDAALAILDSVFNGSLTVTGGSGGSDAGSAACAVTGDDVNGPLSVTDCS